MLLQSCGVKLNSGDLIYKEGVTFKAERIVKNKSKDKGNVIYISPKETHFVQLYLMFENNTGIEQIVDPDHLGSSSYITNLGGEINQHMEYLPFGELLVEEHLNSYNSPFKFNAKEFDAETGNYYYGARYYNPKWSVWLSVDPLAHYNPVMETEFYGDGQHNGGVFNNFNLNPYIYTYQNPVIYVDPNGKQAFFMHGTFVNNIGMSTSSMEAIRQEFKNTTSHHYNMFEANGVAQNLPNTKMGRLKFAVGLYSHVLENRKAGEPITLIGHSHGGNVAIMAANLLEAHFESIEEKVTINLLTINTPAREYSLSENSNVKHYNVYSWEDIVQIAGFKDFDNIPNGLAGRKFDNAFNIRYRDQSSLISPCGFSGHCGQSDQNVNEWLPELSRLRNRVEEFGKRLKSLEIKD